MTAGRGRWVPLTAVVLAALAAACPSGNGSDDGATDGEEGVDLVDAVPDGGDDARPDVGPEGDGEVESDVAPEADSDVVPEVEADGGEADGDDGWDADSILPTGCRFAFPARGLGNGWTGRDGIDDGRVVWRTIDSTSLPSDSVLMVRDLSTGLDREVLRRTYPERLEQPAVHGGNAVFCAETAAGVETSAEVFLVSLGTAFTSPLTANSVPDFYPMAGEEFVVYLSSPDPPPTGMAGEYRYVDLRDGSDHLLGNRGGTTNITFDGHRWVAIMNDHYLYKFDLMDPGAGPQLLGPRAMGITGMAFDRDTGLLITGVHQVGESDDYRLQTWDLNTGETTVLLDQPWSQVMGDVDGRVVVYRDSQAAGETYWAHQLTELRVLDRDTGAIRVVMPLDTYYGVGIWERWIAFNNYGRYGDSLITCDLVAAGYLDEDLHVVPE